MDSESLKRIIDNKVAPKPFGNKIEETVAAYKFAYREVLMYNGYTEEQANIVERLVNDMIIFMNGGEYFE